MHESIIYYNIYDVNNVFHMLLSIMIKQPPYHHVS